MAHTYSILIERTKIKFHTFSPAEFIKLCENGREHKIEMFISLKMQQNLTENQINETDMISDVKNRI